MAAILNNIKVKFLSKLNDKSKHLEIKKSKFMIFLSRFEGFGYPPIESIYNGTRCISYELPVFKETCGNCLDYVGFNDFQAIKNILVEGNYELPENCKKEIQKLYSFEAYSKNLADLFSKKYKYNSNINKVLKYFLKILILDFYFLPNKIALYFFTNDFNSIYWVCVTMRSDELLRCYSNYQFIINNTCYWV